MVSGPVEKRGLPGVASGEGGFAGRCLLFPSSVFCHPLQAHIFSLPVSGQLLDKGFNMVNEFLGLIEPAGDIVGFEPDKIGIVTLQPIIE